jgi:hypothetical protein
LEVFVEEVFFVVVFLAGAFSVFFAVAFFTGAFSAFFSLAVACGF